MRRSRTSILLIAVLTLALGASIACGSKKTEETPKTAATAAASASASATAAPKAAATTAPPKAGVPVITSATFAQAMCNDYKSIASAVPGAAGPPSGPPSATADAAAIQTMMTQMVNAAPSELKPDMTVIAKYFGEYSAAMTRANGDMMKLAQDATFIKMMESGTAEMDKATKNVEAWQQKNCR